jgi:hypothetical protein
MGVMCGHWTWDAWCVSAKVMGIANFYTPTRWLSMLRRGFLHRDISIGNILQLDPPVRMTPFKVQTIEESMAQLSLQHKDKLARHAGLLEVAIGKVVSLDECHGFVIDGDMAARLEGYFTLGDTGERPVSLPSRAGEPY